MSLKRFLLILFCLEALIAQKSFAGCDDGGLGSTFAPSSITALCKDSTAGNYARAIANYGKVGSSYGPYTLAMSPNQRDRQQGLASQLKEIARAMDLLQFRAQQEAGHYQNPDFNLFHDSDVIAIFKNAVKRENRFNSHDSAEFVEWLDLADKKRLMSPNLEMAAAEYNCDRSSGCVDAFTKGAEIVAPKPAMQDDGVNGIISFTSIIRSVGTDPAYVAPLSQLALDLLQRVSDLSSGKAHEVGDLWTDIISEFRKFGNSPERSAEMTWNVLAIYASRGAAMEPLYMYASQGNLPIFAALGVMGSSISILDGYSSGSKKVYSYPAQIHTACDYTRSYHFWMGAFLAHMLMKPGTLKKRDILRGVHELGESYEQFGGSKVNRIATKASIEDVDKMDPHTSYILETQKNIAFNDAGALWALESSAPGRMGTSGIDATILAMHDSAALGRNGDLGLTGLIMSKLISKTFGIDGKAFLEWHDKIQPDANFGSLDAALSR